MTTRLLSIKQSVGRTGKIAYVAQLEPITVDGTKITSASLHNQDFINKKKIKINDYVKIYKAGEIIPYVLDVDTTRENADAIAYEIPQFCPSCHSRLVMYDNLVDQFCMNPECEEKIKQQITYFVSRDVMNIEGLSYSIVCRLYDNNLIKDEWDLYELDTKKDIIMGLDISIKERSYNNLIKAINLSISNSLERLVAGFGIKNIGLSTAKLLAKKFQTLEILMHASFEELTKVNVVGEKSAKELYNFFRSEKMQYIIKRIHDIGFNTQYLSTELKNNEELKAIADLPINAIYKNKSFVITGTFNIPRENIKNILEDIYQAKISNTVTKKTDFVLAGANAGSKLTRAQELKIPVIENEF